jgi:hypothetical protein
MSVEESGEERSWNYLLLYIVILLFWFYGVF